MGSLTPVSGEFKEGGVAGVKLHNVVNFRDKKNWTERFFVVGQRW